MRTSNWSDWKWQLQNRITTIEAIEQVIELTSEEKEAIEKVKFPMAITPYWASLIDKDNPNCPIRKQSIPTLDELSVMDQEFADPLSEDSDSPVPRLVHRYPDRVLLLATEHCSMYCRHCTRRRRIGFERKEDLLLAFEYIRKNRKIKDVLISGGDPLILEDDKIEFILKNLRSIDHLDTIRIGTRVPATLPMRIKPSLVYTLKKYAPIWINIHFNHPKEITKETRQACELLVDNGFPLGSQTVLLKGINDNPYIMKRLMYELIKMRVRPYYLYHCDLAEGIGHFRTTVETGLGIIRKLRGHISGLAVPNYVIDCPTGGGKIPLMPDYVTKMDGTYLLSNYKGESYMYKEEPELVPI